MSKIRTITCDSVYKNSVHFAECFSVNLKHFFFFCKRDKLFPEILDAGRYRVDCGQKKLPIQISPSKIYLMCFPQIENLADTKLIRSATTLDLN